MPSATVEEGVFFHRNDYAGFPRRLATDIIDVATVLLLWVGVSIPVLMTLSDEELEREAPPPLMLPVLLLIMFGYFVILKRSSFRTLGYRFCDVRIVNLSGSTPSVYALTARLLFVVLGPLNFLIDLVWIPSDRHRQALRDKFAHTYVVRLAAQPIGRGPIVYNSYHILGTTFLFPEVESSHG